MIFSIDYIIMITLKGSLNMKDRVLVGSEVIVFLLNHKNQVLLQKRSKLENHNPNTWSLCAGHVEEQDSNLKSAVVREIKEELGIDVLEEKLIELNLEEPHTAHFYYTYINFNKKDFILQEEEVSEIKWYDINMVIKMMENNDDSIINSPRILKLLKILNNKKYVRDVLE